MLHTLYKLKIIGFNSMKKSNYFIFFALGISKESTLKIYQSKIKLVKSPPNILTISIFKNKMSCQTEKQVDEKKVLKKFIVKNSLIVTSIRLFFNIILLMVILFVHLMSLDSRWIKNVQDSCTSAPISPSAPATLQGIFSFLHTLCTRENSMNIHVLHSPGTSSVTVQTETCLKLHLSISETLRDLVRHYIKLNSILIPTFIEAFKTMKQFNYLSFQIIVEDQIACVFSDPPQLLNLKLVCFYPLYSNIINEKFKILLKIYVPLHFIKSVLTLYSRITTFIFSNTRHSTQRSSNDGI